jgi:hypothetical protein
LIRQEAEVFIPKVALNTARTEANDIGTEDMKKVFLSYESIM